MRLHSGYGERNVAPRSEVLLKTPEAFPGRRVPADEFLAALRPMEESVESDARVS